MKTKSLLQWLAEITAIHRALFSLCAGVVVFVALAKIATSATRLMAGWDTFAVCALALLWITIVKFPQPQIRRRAQMQDLNGRLIFVFTILAACASVFAVVFLLLSAKHGDKAHSALHIALCVVAIVASWSLVHTVFALHYAHRFYGDRAGAKGEHSGGLDFPGKEPPGYLDFTYFSFVVGMTCQVSDVQITSRELRGLALAHGALSFAFNTIILALTLNGLAGLLD